MPSKKIQKSKDIATKGKSSAGTKIAQQARAHCNKLNDAQRDALRNRGMQLIYANPVGRKISSRRP